VAEPGRATAAGKDLGALRAAQLDVALHAVALAFGHEGTDLRRGVGRVADRHGVEHRDEPVLHLGLERPWNDDARLVGADLPGVAQRQPADVVDGEIQVGILEDHRGGLAAKFAGRGRGRRP
jgi:hypothetical protein